MSIEIDRNWIIGPFKDLTQMELTWKALKDLDGHMWRDRFDYASVSYLKHFPSGWCSASKPPAGFQSERIISPEDFFKSIGRGIIVDQWSCGCSMLHGHVNSCIYYKKTPYDNLWCIKNQSNR